MTQTSVRPRYFYALDGIRGIAALLVVLRHTGNYFGAIEFPLSYLAVDVFFLLSGIVIANSYEKKLQTGLSPTAFMQIRMARIYPLYIFGSFITVISVFFNLTDEFTTAQALSALPLALLLLPSALNGFPLNGPAWSVFFELISNLAYGIFIKSLTDHVLKLIILLSAFVLVAIVAVHPKHHLDVGFSFPFYGGIFRTTYSFFLGVLLYRKFLASKEPRLPALAKTFMPWLFIAALTFLLILNPSIELRPYLVILIVLFVFPVLIYHSLWFQPNGMGAKIFQTLGLASYGIYALHAPLAVFFNGMLAKNFDIHVEHYAPWSGLAFLVFLFAFCLILDRLYDRPIRRLMLRRSQPSSVVQVSG